MSESGDRPRVAVIHSNDELLRLLRQIAEDAGCDVITARSDELGDVPGDIQQFLRRHDPQVVVYDVSPPYPENWTLFQRVRDADLLSGSRRQFVLTTPNKQVLEQQTGGTGGFELAADRGDRDLIAEAIRRGAAP